MNESQAPGMMPGRVSTKFMEEVVRIIFNLLFLYNSFSMFKYCISKRNKSCKDQNLGTQLAQNE